MKAESAMAYSIPLVAGYGYGQSFHDESPTFSMDDFEGNIMFLVYIVVSVDAGLFEDKFIIRLK